MIKALRLSVINWRSMLNALGIQLCIFLATATFGVLVFGDYAVELFNVFTQSGIGDFASKIILSLQAQTFDSAAFSAELSGVVSNLHNAIGAMKISSQSLGLAYLSLVATLFFYRILISLTDVTVASQIAEFMNSTARRPFIWYFVKRQRRAWAFSVFQCLIASILDVLIVFGTIGIYLMFLVVFSWWTIIPAVAIGAILYSMRLTFMSFCLPSITCEAQMTPSKALTNGLSQIFYHFGKVLWKTIVVIVLLAAIMVASVYVENQFLSAVMIFVPNMYAFYLLKCVGMVEYFEANQRPYFYKKIAIEGTDSFNKQYNKKKR